MDDPTLQAKNLAAQQSVLTAIQQRQQRNSGGGGAANDDDDAAPKQQQHLIDPMNPSEFSRESIMFVRYAVDCLGVQIFDLPPAEVQKLWLDFCIEYNSGNSLTPDWYEATSWHEGLQQQQQQEGQQQQQQQHQPRLIRLDATTWPSLDKTTSHQWNLKLDDANSQARMEDAARTSTKLAQSHFKSFFQMSFFAAQQQ